MFDFARIDRKIQQAKAMQEDMEKREAAIKELAQGLFQRAQENHFTLEVKKADAFLKITADGMISFREAKGRIENLAGLEDLVRAASLPASPVRKLLEVIIESKDLEGLLEVS